MSDERWVREPRTKQRRLLLAGLVGEVTMRGARIEFFGGIIYCYLLGGTKAAECVTLGQNWSTTYEGCLAIIQTEPLSDLNIEIAEVLKRAHIAYGERNAVVHSFWLAQLEGEERAELSVTLKRYGKRRFKRWTVEMLNDLGNRLEGACEEMVVLSDRLEERLGLVE